MSFRKKKDNGGGFLDDFLGGRPVDVSALAKNTVRHDKFDREDYDSILKEMRELAAAEDKLTDAVETGGSAMADTYFSVVKADPALEDPKRIRPSHQINRAVMGEAMELKEHEEMRSYTVGDEIASALACIAMEPELETLFDRLKQEQKLADQLDQQLQELQSLQGQESDLDEMMRQLESGELDDPNGQKAANHQEQQALIEQAMEQLKQDMAAGQDELQAQLKAQGQAIKSSMKNAMGEAIKAASDMDQLSTAWGLDPGALQRLPPEQRLEMARRLANDRFRRIAQLFGPMHRMAFAEQQRKTIHSNDEIYDVEIGNDLSRLLAAELMHIRHPALKLDFYRRFYEGQLLQYKLRGEEKLAKGAIIFCEDGSGSMGGDREIWAKAVGLTLLQIAKAQKRPFYAIHFGGPRMMKEFDFRDPKTVTPEGVIEFAETFFGGGTDFMTPLSRSLDLLREEHSKTGAVKADIVFATDGECGVQDQWLKDFKSEQERMAFRVYGVIIGGSPESEPLKTIADGRVLTVKNLTSGDDLRDIFRNV